MYCNGKDVNKLLWVMIREIMNFLAEAEKGKLPRRCIFTEMYCGKFQTHKTGIVESTGVYQLFNSAINRLPFLFHLFPLFLQEYL